MGKSNKKNLRFFVIMTYVFFLVLFLITGTVTTFLTDNKIVLTILKTICAWSSFFVLMIRFKKFYPNMEKKDFFKNLFKDKLNWKLLFQILLGNFLIFLLCVFSVCYVKNVARTEIVETSIPTLVVLFFINLISGPIGEEPGWRGYFLSELTKDKGIIKASIYSGLLRGLWYTPLWFMMGYSGWQLMLYCVVFLIAIICANIFMGLALQKNNNLVQSIAIHQCVNFLYGAVFIGNRIDIFIPFAIFYLIALTVLCLVVKKKRI